LSASNPGAILLSIREEHAERIFLGTKAFELRKQLPNRAFSRVYLYQAGGQGVVGCFDVVGVRSDTPERLWEAVGERATRRERFESYFANSKVAHAIEITRVVRFKEPLNSRDIRALIPEFSAPQGFTYIPIGSPLAETLESARQASIRDEGSAPCDLVPIRASDRPPFVELVTQHISKNYDEITEEFALQLLQASDDADAHAGFFTRRKEVLAIITRDGSTAGFTTLTYKYGGSIKTGPTILTAEYAHRGFGRRVRVLIENRAAAHRARKVYCTCADSNQDVLRYLLMSGMRVEAHLTTHYTGRNGELVLGKMLVDRSSQRHTVSQRSAPATTINGLGELWTSSEVRTAADMFREHWTDLPIGHVRRLVQDCGSLERTLDRPKPREAFTMWSGPTLVGLGFIVPKRGGALKAVVCCSTSHGPSIRRMIAHVEARADVLRARKVYFPAPAAHRSLVQELHDSGYLCEGWLAEPYRERDDVMLMGKMLRSA
jgi:predicted transcriptional regulator